LQNYAVELVVAMTACVHGVWAAKCGSDFGKRILCWFVHFTLTATSKYYRSMVSIEQ